MDRSSSRFDVPYALALGAFLIVTAGAFGAEPDGKTGVNTPHNPVAASAASVAAGQQVFQKYCRFCHGADAKGNGPMAPKGTHPPDLTDNVWDHGSTDGEIFSIIRDGAPPKFDMKGFQSKITEQDMWNVINYLRSLAVTRSR